MSRPPSPSTSPVAGVPLPRPPTPAPPPGGGDPAPPDPHPALRLRPAAAGGVRVHLAADAGGVRVGHGEHGRPDDAVPAGAEGGAPPPPSPLTSQARRSSRDFRQRLRRPRLLAPPRRMRTRTRGMYDVVIHS